MRNLGLFRQKRAHRIDRFILRVIKLYQAARISKSSNKKIARGRSHSISSLVEDLFASFLIEEDSSIDSVLIDQPIKVEGMQLNFYPDIVVVRDSKITSMIDLKMDMGWNRDGLAGLCHEHAARLEKIRNQRCWVKHGTTKEITELHVSANATYDVVLVSDQNIAADKLQNHLAAVQVLEKDVEVFILTEGEHPNTYGYKPKELLSMLRINYDSFDGILQRIGAGQ